MQALKQAARENDATRLDALCETWSLPARAEIPEEGNAQVDESSEADRK
jgi:hypothetical protein